MASRLGFMRLTSRRPPPDKNWTVEKTDNPLKLRLRRVYAADADSTTDK